MSFFFISRGRSAQAFKTKSLVAAIVVVSLVLFLQLSFSTLGSIKFLAFLIAVYFVGLKGFSRVLLLLTAAAVFFIIPLLPFAYESEFFRALLRSGRELLCFSLILAAASDSVRYDRWPRERTALCIYLLSALFVLTAIQFFSLEYLGNTNVFLNWRLYGDIIDDPRGSENLMTTLPSYWAEVGERYGLALGQEIVLRASAFYTEPSYLGFVVLVLMFSASYLIKSRTLLLYSVAIAFATILMARTASGLITMVIFLLFRFRNQINQRFLGLVLLFTAAVVVLHFSGVIERLVGSATISGDVSGFNRLVKPFINVGTVFGENYFFGIPHEFIGRFLTDFHNGVFVGTGLDNGLVNLFLFYGVGAIAVIAVARKAMIPEALVLFMLSGVFNGALFSFDKAFMLALAFYLAGSFQGKERLLLNENEFYQSRRVTG